MDRPVRMAAYLVTVGLVAAVCLGAPAASASRPVVFHRFGIALHAPNGWFVTNRPLNGVTDPVQRFVLSSYRIPRGADAGGSYTPSSTGVVAQLDEEIPPIANSGAWKPRPARFALPRLGRMETLNGNRWGELLFRTHGRRFYLFIWIGDRAAHSQARLLLRTLDRMRFTAS
jgi:hypothetical protein